MKTPSPVNLSLGAEVLGEDVSLRVVGFASDLSVASVPHE
jgi:hypothetical protein